MKRRVIDKLIFSEVFSVLTTNFSTLNKNFDSNHSKEYVYIGCIDARSSRQKYRRLALVAIDLTCLGSKLILCWLRILLILGRSCFSRFSGVKVKFIKDIFAYTSALTSEDKVFVIMNSLNELFEEN